MKKNYNFRKTKNIILFILAIFCLSISFVFSCSAKTYKQTVTEGIFTLELEITYTHKIDEPDAVYTVRLTNVDENASGEITILDGINEISNYAFKDCKNITKIILPETIVSIGNGVFSGCESLTSIEIPDSVKSIGYHAFDDCKKLKSVKLSNSLGKFESNLFRNCQSLEEIEIPQEVTKINNEVFYGCKNLKKLIIPQSVAEIASNAFLGCDSLEEIILNGDSNFLIDESGILYNKDKTVIICSVFAKDITTYNVPATVKKISDYAFYGCSKLSDINIPDSVESIGSYVFDGTELYNNESNWDNDVLYIDKFLIKAKESVNGKYTIKDGTLLIACNAFKKSSVEEIFIPETLVNIEKYGFYQCENLKNINFSEGIKFIGDYSFANCTSLKKIIIPDTVVVIGKSAFSACVNVEQIVIGKNVKDISDGCFSHLLQLKELVIPSTVERIGKYAFSYLTSLEKIQFSEGLKIIDEGAFSDLEEIKEIYLPDSVETIGDLAFYGLKLSKIRIGKQVKSIGKLAFEASSTYCALSSEEWKSISKTSTSINLYLNHPVMEHSFTKVANIRPASKYRYGEITLACEYGCNKTLAKQGDAPLNPVGEVTGLAGTIQGCSILLTWNKAVNATHYIIYQFDEGCWFEYDYTQDTQYRFHGKVLAEAYAVRACGIDWDEVGEVELRSDNFARFFNDYAGFSNEYNVKYTNNMSYGDSGAGHIYGSYKTIKKATCSSAGSKQRTCTTCGNVETVSIAKKAHSEAVVKGKSATCTKTGLTDGKKCSVCGTVTVVQKTIAKKAHTNKTTTTKATLTKSGKTETKCTVCGKVSKTTTVYYPKSIKLSATSYTYNGKAKTPTVTVKDSKGKELKKDTDYTVKYESGRKLPGKYTVTVTFKGKYSGTKKLYFTITPKTTSKVTATQTTTSVTLNWSKVTGATGYRVLQKVNGKWKVLADVTKLTYTVKKLDAGTNYTFAVRPYTVDGKSTVLASTYTQLNTATKCKTPTLKLTSTKKGVAAASWTNVAGETGYELYGSSKKSSGFKSIATTKVNVVKASKKKLTSKKTYYFKVRAYKTVDGVKVYSDWSAVKSVKVK